MFTAWLPLITFIAIGLTLMMLGRWLISLGRRGTDASQRGRPMFGPLTPALAAALPRGQKQQTMVEKEMKQAGYYHHLASQQFFALRNALLLGWAVLTAATVAAATSPTSDPTQKILIVAIVIGLLLYGAPRLMLQSMAARRIKLLQTGLPDALDMITMCMTGGITLQQSLERVGQELRNSHAELALELQIIRRQAQTHTLGWAMEQFSNRTGDPEIQSLTALVSQSEQLGTNVATSLRDYADGIRRSQRQRAEERGNKASVKMLLPVALCLAPPVYILLLAPAMLELREFLVRENRPGGVLAPSEPGSATRSPSSLREALEGARESSTGS